MGRELGCDLRRYLSKSAAVAPATRRAVAMEAENFIFAKRIEEEVLVRKRVFVDTRRFAVVMVKE